MPTPAATPGVASPGADDPVLSTRVLAPVAAGGTDIGQRDHNEDHVLLRPELGLFVLADGAGGHNAGKVASALATTTVANLFETTATSLIKRPEVDQFGSVDDRAPPVRGDPQRQRRDRRHRQAREEVPRHGLHGGGDRLRPRGRHDPRGARRRQPLLPPAPRDPRAHDHRPLVRGRRAGDASGRRRLAHRAHAAEHHHPGPRDGGEPPGPGANDARLLRRPLHALLRRPEWRARRRADGGDPPGDAVADRPRPRAHRRRPGGRGPRQHRGHRPRMPGDRRAPRSGGRRIARRSSTPRLRRGRR